MSKVCMIEYQGRCDLVGQSVGHAPKVLVDYYRLLNKDVDISVMAPKSLLNNVSAFMTESEKKELKSKVLPHHIVMKDNNVFEKIYNKLKMFSNIKLAIKHSDAEVLWFFNVEFYLMLYLAFARKPAARVVVTMFQDGFYGGAIAKLKQKIFERAQKKIELIVATGPGLSYRNCQSVFIPDYYYVPEKYDSYQSMKKENRAICIGTMGAGKQIKQMVDAFSKITYPLLVEGRFYDEAEVKMLKERAGENVTIINKYLSDDEYLSLLGSSKYVILPYCPGKYKAQTSGVLQEALFLNTVPISFAEVLKGNEVDGIAFDEWDDISDSLFSENLDEYYTKYENLRNERYNENAMRKEYIKAFG